MSDELRDLLHVVALTELGRRLQEAREAAGMSRDDLADGLVNASYLALVEDGRRRPALKLITAFCVRLASSPEVVISGLSSEEHARIRSTLDLADLGLSSNDTTAALAAAEDALACLRGRTAPSLSRAAYRLRARAREASGDLDGAIIDLVAIIDEATEPAQQDLAWVRDLIALSRCYRESGQLDRAVQVERAARPDIEARGLDATTEAVQLTITTSGAYIFQGDLGQAMRTCRRAIAEAERHGLPLAKASAQWNASVVLKATGERDAALRLAQEALAIFEASDDTKNLGRLRSHVASLHLTVRPSDPDLALTLLERAGTELDWSTAGSLDRSSHLLAVATAQFSLGNIGHAQRMLEESCELAPVGATALRAHQAALRGRLAAVRDDLNSARREYESAVALLTASGADQHAAQLWFELGDLFMKAGAEAPAIDAYRRAGASQGLRPPSVN